MSPNNTPCIGSGTDSDDERINRLIARYANIRDTSKERQVGDFKTDKNNGANSRSTLGQSTSLMQADPTMSINYFYKIHSADSDSIEKENDDGNRIRLTWHDSSFYDSSHSPSHDTESTISNKREYWLKVPPEKHISKSRVTFRDQIKDQQTSLKSRSDNVLKKSYAEKTTYCRPTNKTYDSHFVHKVMEKNAKLQLLLTKYVVARQKEKEKEEWSDFVNSLKEKRRCYRKLSTQFSSPFMRGEDTKPLLVKDLSADNKLTHPESCQEILHDLYNPKTELCPEIFPKPEQSTPLNIKTISSVYGNQLHWFPSTSRVRKAYAERTNHGRPSLILSDENISINKAIRTKMHEHTNFLKYTRAANTEMSCQYDSTCYIEPKSKEHKDIQTHNTFASYPNPVSYYAGESQLRDMVSELLVAKRNKNRIDDKVTRKKTRDGSTQHDYEFNESGQLSKLTLKQKMMRKRLEKEHEIFNNLFRSFMTDLETNERLNFENSNIFHFTKVDDITDSAQISPSNAKKNKRITLVGDVMTNTSVTAFEAQRTTSQHLLNSKFDKILYEELDKSNKLRSDIEAMLNHTAYRPCAVKISIDIPTKERSTEVTDSLSKTKLSDSPIQKMVIKDVSSPINCHVPRTRQKNNDKQKYVKSQRRTAVNTDPVGLLSLLKLSTETAKRILSFVPNITWQQPKALPAPPIINYVCNVCGAIFAHPSELSAHILEHNLGQVRDCRVHRRATEPPGSLFRCRYCGQLFTRSHCCELHQSACARRHDQRHGGSSLVMLR